MDKRSFIKNLSLASISASPFFRQLDSWLDELGSISPEEAAKDEDFWRKIRAAYKLKPDYINLENGYYCFIPEETLENLIWHIRHVNYEASHYMRSVQWDNKRKVQEKLAKLIDCDPDEVVLTRNTTESLDTIIGGFPWKEGDEAVMAEQDYGSMLNMFELVAARYGVVNRRVSVPNHPKNDEEIVKLYENAITDKTRLLMVCHMINITGQILPIRKICDMAHSKGVDVMVDGAHAYGHIHFKMADLDCDYYGSSLHKWLSAPLGAGLLYIKKEHIPKIWPTFAHWKTEADDIRRLNHTGTHPCHTDLAVGNALEFHNRIGPERKEARLRFLQNYWTNQVRDLPHIILNTPKETHRSCGIANVGVKGMKPHDLAKTLMDKYKIWTVAIDGANVHGCRICPNLYTSLEELDVFVKALKDLS